MTQRVAVSSVVGVGVTVLAMLLSPVAGVSAVTPVRPAMVASPTEDSPELDPAPADTTITPFSPGTTRLQGADRYETAVVTSQRYAPGVPVVFVATGANFPDALSAAAAAAKLGGPLLLTMPGSLPASVASELDRLDPAQIYLLGGTGAISSAVEGAISAYGPVTRLGGADRYATGLRITSEAFTSAPMVVIATGRNFPDALAATGLAGAKGAPVILVDGPAGAVPAATVQLITDLGPSSIVIAGGVNAVSSAIESQLGAIAPVTRYAGADRYATAAAINSANFPTASVVFLATGTNFPDALAGAALAGRLGAPLFITTRDCTPTVIHDALLSLSPSALVVLGGTGAVSANAAANGDCAAPPPNPGNAVNCDDFSNWAEAQNWFNTYYPYYGDVAGLDADHDLIACELLPGAP